jgi:hypothetical protein
MPFRAWELTVDGFFDRVVKANSVAAARAQAEVLHPGREVHLTPVKLERAPAGPGTGPGGNKFTFPAFGGGVGEFL